ncbi:MAG TPA: lipopolysaccharide heptosyltransferase II [Usitatibacter sp.]|nr:lipopolysaccharide heptosyltransferase II [Usitatibacter sp.]
MTTTWAEARNVLCVRLDNMGDLLMTTPAIRALKESLPGRRITLLASRSSAKAAACIPEVDEVIAYDAPWMKHEKAMDPLADLEMRDELQRRAFDAAAIFTVYSQSSLPAAMLCYLAGIPLRLAHCRENPYHLLTDWVRESDPAPVVRHEVRRQLDLVATVGARTQDEHLSFRVSPAGNGRAAMKLEESGLDPSRPFIVVHPGATAPSRRWRPERFAQVARELSMLLDFQVVVTGDASERELAEAVRRGAGPRAWSLAGSLTLEEFAATIEMASLVLSNNTGAVHLAAALRTPVVDLYALTNPQHTPWMVAHRVLSKDVPCRNCYKSVCPEGHHLCLDGVAVDEVVAAAADLWLEIHWRAAA